MSEVCAYFESGSSARIAKDVLERLLKIENVLFNYNITGKKLVVLVKCDNESMLKAGYHSSKRLIDMLLELDKI
jgi:hypothetical protein